MAPPASILVVDDEPSLCRLLDRILTQEGFGVTIANSGEQALEVLRERLIDLTILDLDMPGISGQEVCRRIRRESRFESVAILVLTGGGTEGQTARCLDSGADDFMEKPADNMELVSRVRAILRRPRTLIPTDGVLRRGSVVIEPSTRKVTVNGSAIQFAPKEFEIFNQLVLHAPRVIDRNTLALKVWGVTIDLLNGRTMDVHIRRIREKLGPLAPSLKTVQTIGFQWDEPAPSSLQP